MHYDDPLYEATVRHIAHSMMRSFEAWNYEQELLAQMGEENERCTSEEMDEMWCAFLAISERLVLEDVLIDLEWLATTWAGIDGNTGRSSYFIDFVSGDLAFPSWAVLSFYVTSNAACWFATPLAMLEDPKHLALSEANSVREAIMCICD